MLSSKLHSSIGNTDKLYVDDVFSAYTYTGNGSTQTINNGIDLAGEGGLVWIKGRSGGDHMVVDTARGVGRYSSLQTNAPNSAAAFNVGPDFTSFNSNGFTLGVPTFTGRFNSADFPYISWTFRKAPKFFDVVTYTGNGATNRQIAHGLGIQAGFVTVKATSTTGDWNSYHHSATGDLRLNLTDAQTASRTITTAADASTFTVSGVANTNGATYVAYLFAHDTSADGIVQCGSYVGNSSATGPVINLGWEPQYLLIKRATVDIASWRIVDVSRGMPVGQNAATLQANLSASEGTVRTADPLPTGFQINSAGTEVNSSGSTYIYLAIRRPNKPPTTGTEVYNAIARTGTGVAATVTGVGFAPDFSGIMDRGGNRYSFIDRLRGTTQEVYTYTTATEATSSDRVKSLDMSGISLGTDASGYVNFNGSNYINHFFRRAPGFFDVVCYTGTGAAQTVNHSLGVAPELVIVKCRSHSDSWYVYSAAVGLDFVSNLNNTNVFGSGASNQYWGGTTPSASVISLGTSNSISARTYVAYLFASLPGISKVGTYTGNGSSQTINCGFSTGARFVLIKRTNSTGDWFVWDTTRGIVSANDPHLSLNTPDAEVTANDSVDPDGTGFIVNQVAATNINVTSATYLYLAIS